MVKNVTFFGYSQAKTGDSDYDASYQTAKLLAQNGYLVINGGGPGIMKASSEEPRQEEENVLAFLLILKI